MADQERAWLTPGYRPTPEQRARAIAWMRKRYEDGASIRLIAGEVGRSYDFVRQNLLNAGTTLRPRSTKRPLPKWVPPKPSAPPRTTSTGRGRAAT
ncbi:helix-turn-helix domain-containing protein [Streptomyces murinus]|uniref:helix-turn-helix domain-containing protein n=1 Tax=Streptomyces murinus TaxID=33900 RepID=UPI003808C69C